MKPTEKAILPNNMEELKVLLEQKNRELEIEAALERVRACSMGMNNSEELVEVVRLLDKEIAGLSVEVNGSQIVTDFANPEKSVNDWYAREGQNYLEKFHIPYLEHPLTKRVYNALHKGVDFYTENYSKAEKNKYFRLLFKYSDFGKIPKERQEFIYHSPAWIRAVVVSKNSILVFQRFVLKEFTREEEGIFKRFGKVFEQAYTRFLDLQKAEAQAREAQIEAALERVRSRTMGMQNSEELAEVIAQINAEITNLGIRSDNTGLITDIKLNEKSGSYCTWFSIPGKTYSNKFLIPRMQHRLFEKMEEAYQRKIEFFTISFTKEEKDRYLNFVFAESDLKSIPESRKKFLLNAPGWSQSVVLHKNSGLALQRFSNESFSEEENAVAIRFGHVFEQTYTRFLDLQKAETQAREAQIEAALERVRAASMAMHKSDELQEVISVVLNQMISLGIKTDVSYIVINAENTKDFNLWLATENNDYARQINLPYFKHPIHDDALKAIKKQVGLDTHSYSKEEKNRYFEYQFKHSDLKYSPEERKKFILDAPGYTRTIAINKHTSIAVNNYATTKFSTEENEILIRIAKVFEQAYTRFLDIKKAEAQAREAQIEAALERVRAKAMSMQNSEDLNATIGAFYRELEQFSITPRRCGVGLLQKNRLAELSTMNTLVQGNSIEIIGKLKMEGHWVLDGVYDNWCLQKEFHPVLRGNEIKEYNQILKPQMDFPEYPNNSVQFGYFFFFPEGGVYAWTEKEMKEDELKIYRRFTTVLSLTYKRYKDLKDAEANAHEAVKRASLDRVRAEIASMRSVDDLQRITPLIWHELITLGVPFVRCGVFIFNEATAHVQVFLSSPDGHSLAVLDLSFDSGELTRNTVNHWRKGLIFKTHWNRQQFMNWMQSMIKMGQVSNSETYQGASKPPESLHLHFVPFKQGMLYVGNILSLEPDALELVKALAESFSIAYARYEDFRQLEEAKNQIEKTFTDLKAAQSQLIQAEKMASLGELTAGIAHEIQNPLNFVNNFSELSKELIGEMNDELAVGTEASLQLAREIAGDVEQNLEKINHHGKRAADIVKGMLQHSRSSSGQKEPTNINALADEYLRLAYHGLRAKDKTFNALMKTEFDSTIGKIEVIPQDIGRVILNLITNAFYVVDEKKKLLNDGFEPIVSVSTKKMNNQIAISVKDNGNGIPNHILDKIFQPFFTTKPTGLGTGLGLSLSYDIVKAHGGELKVETKEGEGSQFIIQLPALNEIIK